MNLTDPVADMLTRIRNACSAGHRRVDMPVSKLKAEVARLLRDNHYIADFKVLDDGGAGGQGPSKPALQFEHRENQYRLQNIWESPTEGQSIIQHK